MRWSSALTASSKLILGVTGHRLHLLPGYRGDGSSQRLRTRLLEIATAKVEEWHPDRVNTGMATGWDMAMAAACMFLNVPFRAYVPFEGQDRHWSDADRTMYRSLLDEAESVVVQSPTERRAAYIERDMQMVDDSSRLLALWNGDPTTGTGRTITYAEGWLVPWSNVWEEFTNENGPEPL